MTTVISDGCYFDGKPVGDDDPCCVDVGWFSYNNNNQSIPTSTWTWLDLRVKRDENPVGSCNLATDTYTCPVEGRYTFTSHVQMECYAGYTTVAIELWKNGALLAQHTDYNTFDSIHSCNLCLVDWCAAGDFYKVRMWQDSGLTANLLTLTCEQSFFSGALIYQQ